MAREMNTAAACPAGDNSAFQIQLPYYSKGIWRIPRTPVGAAFSYDLPVGTKISLFSYGRNKDKTSAGYVQTDGVAKDSDTNIIKGNETIAGELVEITGLSLMPMPISSFFPAAGPIQWQLQDRRALAILASCVNVKVVLNERGLLDFGIPLFCPGSGGLDGKADRTSEGGADLAGDWLQGGYPNNGLATRGNTFGMPDPIYWNPSGADSLLSVDMTIDRPLHLDTPAAVIANNTSGVVATGEHGFSPPEFIVSEWMCMLHGTVKGVRSRNI